MTRTLSVTELTTQIKSLLEVTFLSVSVEGEVSNLTYHTSGHLYFSIKDSGSSLRCVMFKSAASRLKFRLEPGLKVIVSGGITLFTPRGEYQLQCSGIEPAGAGSLALAYEQLKARLSALGYFDPARKKPLPRYPRRVALITSATGAAIQDMQRVAQRRWPLVRLAVYNVLVQGENAAAMIARALRRADGEGYDVIVIGRGGGSAEDLWAFNEEAVAQAVFGAVTPVVSAVGHEVDYVISDFVADVRAATPSAAMEMILPDADEMRMTLDEAAEQLHHRMAAEIRRREALLAQAASQLGHHSPAARLAGQRSVLERLAQEYRRIAAYRRERQRQAPEALAREYRLVIDALLNARRQLVTLMRQRVEQSDPALSMRPMTAQIVKEGRRVALASVEIGDTVLLEDPTCRLEAYVKTKSFLNMTEK